MKTLERIRASQAVLFEVSGLLSFNQNVKY